MGAKHVVGVAAIAFVVVALVGHVTMLKTLAGFQATS
jgi:hypothetical protein